MDGGSVYRYSTVALPGWCLSCAGTDQVERSGSAALAMQAIILAIRAVGYESYAELLIMTRGWVGWVGWTGGLGSGTSPYSVLRKLYSASSTSSCVGCSCSALL